MASRSGGSEPGGGSSVSQAVRARALDLLVHCYAEAVGAHTALLLDQRTNPGVEVLATWSREGRDVSPQWTSESLLERALRGDGPLVESQPPGGRHRASAAPVTSNDGVIGAIYAGFEPPTAQGRDQLVWTTESYARLAALCMSGADLTLSDALGSARYDPLTGCLTYGATVEVLKSEVQRSQRRGHRMAVCMMDLDGFKRVNDQRGHIEGNRVLHTVGGALRSTAREYDAVGRFGGDEFVIVLPETGGRDGERIAGRFLANLRSATGTVTPIPLDASVGVVEWDGECSPVDLLDQADRVMREVKSTGGGRVKSDQSARARHDAFTELSRYAFGASRDQANDTATE